jgi:hypothetical protein
MTKAEALEMAARCWCTANTGGVQMSAALATQFAETLIEVIEEIETYEPEDYDILEEG